MCLILNDEDNYYSQLHVSLLLRNARFAKNMGDDVQNSEFRCWVSIESQSQMLNEADCNYSFSDLFSVNLKPEYFVWILRVVFIHLFGFSHIVLFTVK